MLKRELYITEDGSNSIYLPEWNEYYHSKKGAVQEALHVFLKMGMDAAALLSRKRTPEKPTLAILEYGLGTGLNAFLTAQHAPKDVAVHYTAVEAYPVTSQEVTAMDYGKLLNDDALYKRLHALSWETVQSLTDTVTLTKLHQKFEDITAEGIYDLVYYDVFGPRVQPELWSMDMITAAYNAMRENGILVTYCAAGFVRRNMIAAGFTVERLPGPPGKREMLRAIKE